MSDSISRQVAIDAFERFIHELGIEDEPYNYGEMALSAQNVPSVENKGEWIAQDIHNCHTNFKCSECGYIHSFLHLYGEPTADYTYCPNCGADMRGKAE
jgi:predicted RNA-binding Zn-ribbon protein involved in translation (DUF1610 family)